MPNLEGKDAGPWLNPPEAATLDGPPLPPTPMMSLICSSWPAFGAFRRFRSCYWRVGNGFFNSRKIKYKNSLIKKRNLRRREDVHIPWICAVVVFVKTSTEFRSSEALARSARARKAGKVAGCQDDARAQRTAGLYHAIGIVAQTILFLFQLDNLDLTFVLTRRPEKVRFNFSTNGLVPFMLRFLPSGSVLLPFPLFWFFVAGRLLCRRQIGPFLHFGRRFCRICL